MTVGTFNISKAGSVEIIEVIFTSADWLFSIVKSRSRSTPMVVLPTSILVCPTVIGLALLSGPSKRLKVLAGLMVRVNWSLAATQGPAPSGSSVVRVRITLPITRSSGPGV